MPNVDPGVLATMTDLHCRLFQNSDPFGEPFSEQLPNRIMLCPTNGYLLTPEQYTAMVRTARMLGEETFYVAETEGQPYPSAEGNNWCLGVSTPYAEYGSLPIALENSIYSVTGRWAVIISHEEHALFGGTDAAMTYLKMELPGWQDGMRTFRRMWQSNSEKYGADIGWIPRLLVHLGQRTPR